MRRFLPFLAALVLVLGTASPASAATLDQRCGLKWKNLNYQEALNWCVELGYNDITGNIQGAFFYSDYTSGNVYAIKVTDVLLWRQVDGENSVKDSCIDCPVAVYVYDSRDELSTGWSGYTCGRYYLVQADFRIKWDSDDDFGPVLSRTTDWNLLC